MAVRVQVLDEKGLPVHCTVAAIRTSDQTILNLYPTNSEGVAEINEAGTWYPRPMVTPTYKARVRMVILNDSGSMNADYVVDSNGGGTHAALYGVNGALAAALAAGTSKYIWVCTTHSEPVITSTQSLNALVSGVVITVASGSEYRPILPVGANIAVHQTTGAGQAGGRIVYRNVQFNANSTFTVDLFDLQNTGNVPAVELDGVRFGGAGTIRAGVINGAGVSNDFIMTRCTGTIQYPVTVGGVGSTLNNLGFNGNTGAGSVLIVRGNNLSSINLVFRIADTHTEPCSKYDITDNHWTFTSYMFQMTYAVQMAIVGNVISAAYNGALMQWGTTGGIDIRAAVTGNYVDMTGGGVGSRAVYTNNFAGAVATEFAVIGNAFRGPGAGASAIEIGASLGGTMVLEPNAFYNWGGGNLTGGGIKTTVSGPWQFAPTLTVSGNADSLGNRMVLLDNTGVAHSVIMYRRSGVDKGFLGLWPTSGAAPFGANDLYFGTYDGTYHDVFAIQNDGTKLKFVNNAFVGGYLRVGQGSPWTAPTGVLAGDITGSRVRFVSPRQEVRFDAAEGTTPAMWRQFVSTPTTSAPDDHVFYLAYNASRATPETWAVRDVDNEAAVIWSLESNFLGSTEWNLDIAAPAVGALTLRRPFSFNYNLTTFASDLFFGSQVYFADGLSAATPPSPSAVIIDKRGASESIRLRGSTGNERYRMVLDASDVNGLNITAYDDTGGVYLPVRYNSSEQSLYLGGVADSGFRVFNGGGGGTIFRLWANSPAARYRADFSRAASDMALTIYDQVSGVYQPFLVNGSTFNFQPSGVTASGFIGDGNGVRVAGYSRIGSLSAPVNIVSGDLTIARLFTTGNVVIGSETPTLHRLSIGITTALDTEKAIQLNWTQNNSALLGGIPVAFGFDVVDAATANRLSLQMFRFVFTRNVGATGIPTAGFDAISVLTPIINESYAARLDGYRAERPVVAAGKTMNEWVAFNADSGGGGSGTLTVLRGLEVGAGFTSGIRNASNSIFTPSAQQSIALAAAILANATVVQVSTTAAGNMTAAPTIADGVDGQVLIVVNTGVNAFTLQDQGTLAGSNLRLSAAGVTLGTRDSILLMYSAAVGDWIEIGQTNVL